MPSPWVTRALNDDIPGQAFAGNRDAKAYVDDGFDEDAPLGSQPEWTRERDMHDEDIDTFLAQNDRLVWDDEPRVRLTMKRVTERPSVFITYENGKPVVWEL